MNTLKQTLPKAVLFLLAAILLCGVLYTAVVTGLAQLIFPENAYGCELLAQQYTDDAHLWGRIMELDVTTHVDEEGNALLYAHPSNLSPASEEYEALVAERVEQLRAADPEKAGEPIPVDLVTCSASGLDPHISPAAAEYQVSRIARARGMTEEEVRSVIEACTDQPFLGIFGEATVNVLEVNLTLDGILTD